MTNQIEYLGYTLMFCKIKLINSSNSKHMGIFWHIGLCNRSRLLKLAQLCTAELNIMSEPVLAECML